MVELVIPAQQVQTDQLGRLAIPVQEQLLVTPVLAAMPVQQAM